MDGTPPINRLPLEIRRLILQEVTDGILQPNDLKELAHRLFPLLDIFGGHRVSVKDDDSGDTIDTDRLTRNS